MIGLEATQAKSDQLNAIDLVDPTVFRVEKAVYHEKDKQQPVHIHLEGYEGRPYKPSLGMRRGLVSTQVWTREEGDWAGRLIELYCDPSVQWAGKESGGIKISAVSGIKEPYKFTLRESRTKQSIHTFNVLDSGTQVKKKFILTHYIDDIESATTGAEIDAIVKLVMAEFGNDELDQLKECVTQARENIKQQAKS